MDERSALHARLLISGIINDLPVWLADHLSPASFDCTTLTTHRYPRNLPNLEPHRKDSYALQLTEASKELGN